MTRLPSEGEEIRMETAGPEETGRFGERLGGMLRPGDVIGLVGPLGSGKTCMVQGIARALEVPERQCVRSPTFIILNMYTGRLPLYHFDLYRISTLEELEEIGFREAIEGGGVSVIEWADRVPEVLPRDHILITIQHRGGDRRLLSVSAGGERFCCVLRTLIAEC